MPDRTLREEELLIRLGWFIRVRWLFLVGLGLTILVAHFVFQVSFPVWRALAVGGVILLYNLAFYTYHRLLRSRSVPDLTISRVEAMLQIGLDLLAVTFLIHYAGAAENPFLFFYLFHAIVGSMLLSRTEVWIVGIAAFGLFIAVLALEYFGVIPHYQLKGLTFVSRHQNLLFLAVVTLAYGATLFTTIYMTSSIVSGLRERELQLVVAQKMLLKKSDDLERAHAELKEKQTQLVQTEKQASLGQLVAGIAHEINNPMQFIQGNMAILREAMEDVFPYIHRLAAQDPELKIARLPYSFFREQFPVLIKDMMDGTTRIRDIVKDLKTFARKDEGRLDEEVNLNDVVQASERLLHNKIKHYKIVEELDATLPKIRGNMNQLQQVVVNTLLNAAEALGGQGNATIRLATRTVDDGRRVRLSITDNGPGIPDTVKDRIFDPFFTTKIRTDGTGLGLSITYGIIEQHQGTIEVDSKVDGGTTFHYCLPVDRSRSST